MPQIFGPVPSRRLGFSLGVDLVPFKTCSFDCVYCQLGRTTVQTTERSAFVDANSVVAELEAVLEQKPRVDYITFSGSGEPTLYAGLGDLIDRVKHGFRAPVAVLTNGSLCGDPGLREELSRADLIVPSLDAMSPEVFAAVNRPDPSVDLDAMLLGIEKLCRAGEVEVWIEVMLVAGMNDTDEEISRLADALSRMRPEKIQLNTVVRPPADPGVHPISKERMNAIRERLGPSCEIIAEWHREGQRAYRRDLAEAIGAYTRRRPGTVADLAHSLGVHRNEIIKYTEALEMQGLLKSRLHGEQRYYSWVGADESSSTGSGSRC